MALSPGEKFWVGLGAYVLAADVLLWRNDKATMSQEFGRWLQTRHGRYACAGATAFLVGHLFLELPIPGQTNLKKVATYRRNGNGECNGR
jgi:hypothetical protein